MSFIKEAFKSVITLGASTRVKRKQNRLENIYYKYENKKEKMDKLNSFVKKDLNKLIESKKRALLILKKTERLFKFK